MKHNTAKYRVWTGYEVIETDTPPQDGDGRVLRASGLTDKDGQEIYECDVVLITPLRKDAVRTRGTVEFDESRQNFWVRQGTSLARLDTQWNEVLVVGNAFEK